MGTCATCETPLRGRQKVYCSVPCRGKWFRGKPLSPEHRQKIKMSTAGRQGHPNPSWYLKELSFRWSGDRNPKWQPDREALHLRSFLKGKCHWLLRRTLRALKQQKQGTTRQLLGYGPDELREHIQRLWKPGMTWENYGRMGWHIDHIRPISKWPLDADPANVNALSNLQPMWWEENLKKGSSYIQEKRFG